VLLPLLRLLCNHPGIRAGVLSAGNLQVVDSACHRKPHRLLPHESRRLPRFAHTQSGWSVGLSSSQKDDSRIAASKLHPVVPFKRLMNIKSDMCRNYRRKVRRSAARRLNPSAQSLRLQFRTLYQDHQQQLFASAPEPVLRKLKPQRLMPAQLYQARDPHATRFLADSTESALDPRWSNATNALHVMPYVNFNPGVPDHGPHLKALGLPGDLTEGWSETTRIRLSGEGVGKLRTWMWISIECHLQRT